ncbi:MAG: SDR family NAD(P)-dependent oxidoreductase [Actinobacteria bacterium]|nr:SDR family NAD(P)-dependent oxidoreductase [Actinomycetota bacterium]
MAWIENKRVVVTGATSGIGREVAGRLASLGAEVVLACRDGVRGGCEADDINAATATPLASVMTVDTSDHRSIGAFALEYRQRYGSLDVLVNNAGVLCPDRRTSVDGVELTFATNVMGYYLLTGELLGSLAAASAPRVVNVASTFAFDLDLDDLQRERRPYDGMSAYAQSKACDRLLTWAFARRLQPEGITVNAMAPGLVLDTCLYRELTPEAKQALEQYGSRSITDGADTAVWLASSPEVSGVTGRFFEQGAEVPCELRDEGDEERLWQACEELAGRLDSTG